MNKVISYNKKPIKLWLDDIEAGALEQASNLANLPFLFKHVAIMPDSHQGYGMPIGGVIATKDVIIPNAVGVDIGCGMQAIATNIDTDNISREELINIVNLIKKAIPVGFKHHNTPQDEAFMYFATYSPDEFPVVNSEYENALYQLGTLGGGNHFIELQKDTNNKLWIMLHSGSRNLGFKVAQHYNRLAVELNDKWFSSVPKSWQLAFLPIDNPIGKSYIREMNFCINFAKNNRDLMMNRIKAIIFSIINNVEFEESIDISHNFAALENHFGKNVMVHRKGATRARNGEIRIIPGSQGTKSYIVSGLGNKESFMSCSHGAGRAMGRKEAQKKLNLDKEIEFMNSKGIIHSIKTIRDLDESPNAYKNIDVVMNNQKDLVKIVEELTPIAVVKG